jgi:hypothetical protein
MSEEYDISANMKLSTLQIKSLIDADGVLSCTNGVVSSSGAPPVPSVSYEVVYGPHITAKENRFNNWAAVQAYAATLNDQDILTIYFDFTGVIHTNSPPEYNITVGGIVGPAIRIEVVLNSWSDRANNVQGIVIFDGHTSPSIPSVVNLISIGDYLQVNITDVDDLLAYSLILGLGNQNDVVDLHIGRDSFLSFVGSGGVTPYRPITNALLVIIDMIKGGGNISNGGSFLRLSGAGVTCMIFTDFNSFGGPSVFERDDPSSNIVFYSTNNTSFLNQGSIAPVILEADQTTTTTSQYTQPDNMLGIAEWYNVTGDTKVAALLVNPDNIVDFKNIFHCHHDKTGFAVNTSTLSPSGEGALTAVVSGYYTVQFNCYIANSPPGSVANGAAYVASTFYPDRYGQQAWVIYGGLYSDYVTVNICTSMFLSAGEQVYPVISVYNGAVQEQNYDILGSGPPSARFSLTPVFVTG